MAILPKAKAAVKKLVKPKRPVFVEPPPPPKVKPKAAKPEVKNLEPAVYTPPPPAPPEAVPPPPKRKERPPLPVRFVNGGGTAEEREAWIRENWDG